VRQDLTIHPVDDVRTVIELALEPVLVHDLDTPVDQAA
jgi:hypothetical protein